MKKTYRVEVATYSMMEYWDSYEVEAENEELAKAEALSGTLVSEDLETNYDIEMTDELLRGLANNSIPVSAVHECVEIPSKDQREAKRLLEEQRDLIQKVEYHNQKLRELNSKFK